MKNLLPIILKLVEFLLGLWDRNRNPKVPEQPCKKEEKRPPQDTLN